VGYIEGPEVGLISKAYSWATQTRATTLIVREMARGIRGSDSEERRVVEGGIGVQGVHRGIVVL
jgi:hypothetical protein